MNLQELLENIRQEQEKFSGAQKLVAAYVVDNYKQIPFLSISVLSQNIGVSENTVVKFCNRMGFNKFSEFKKAFSEYACSELVVYNKLSESNEQNSDDFFEQELKDDIKAIKTTLSDPGNRKLLPQLLDMMDKAKHIYITGGRASGRLAGLFASLLRYLDLKVYEVDFGMGDYWDRIAMIEQDDLVIAISFPRYTSQIVKGLESLHKSGVPIALITDTGLSPAHPYADVVFHCTVTSGSYLHCYAGCLSLISTICRATGAARKQKASDHICQLEQHLLEQGIFI